MSELMINATPSLPPSGTGNANALNQGEASSRPVASAGANLDSAAESPFAAVLKSRMGRSDTDAVENTDSSAVPTQVDAGNAATSVDLALLLPFLGANPASASGQASAPAAVTETSAEEQRLPELLAATEPGSARILAGLPTTPTAILPAALAAASAAGGLPATPAATLAAPPAGTAGTRSAVPTDALPSGATAGMEPSRRKQSGEAMDQAFASANQANSGGTGQAPGKMLPDAAINADTGRKNGGQTALEAPASDFHALMERAAAMTPGAASPSNGPSANPSLRIDTPLGQTGWREETGQKLTWMVANGRQQADLVLTPPNLGRVEVSLTMNGDQASAIFTSPNPAVREALESSLHRLREILADAGVSLGQAQVGSDSPNPSPRKEDPGDKPGFASNEGVRFASSLPLPGATAVARPGAGRGMIDIFA
ncbi:MAG: flagellar hook-length control protein FliK [Sulfuritalea sp.]|nr:flagellar hook-length control protein FliK [Sulfuritalea sp.]